jgi:hypothetical protein
MLVANEGILTINNPTDSDGPFWIGVDPYSSYKLLHYTSQYWYQHIKDLETGARLEEYVAKLVSPQLITSHWW